MAENNSEADEKLLAHIVERAKWNSSTPLILAAQAAKVDVMKNILDGNYEEINHIDHIGNNALMAAAESVLLIACEFGKTKTALWVINNQPAETFDANVATKRNKISALHFAAMAANESIVAKLLECKNIDCNAETAWGDSPLIWAAIGGNLNIIRWLVDRNAKVNQKSKAGFTALRKAAEGGHIEIVRYLLDNGAEPSNDARLDALKQGKVAAAHLFYKPDDKFSNIFERKTRRQMMADLGRLYASDSFRDAIKQIMILAAQNHSKTHDPFYLEFLKRLIPKLQGQSPNSVLNEVLPAFYRALYERCRGKDGFDVDLVKVLVDMATILPTVKAKHPLEITDFDKRFEVVMNMLKECVENSRCFSNNSKIKQILCFGSFKEFARKSSEQHQVVYTNELVERGQAFRAGLLETCVHGKVLAIFCSSHVGIYVDNLFWGLLRHRKAMVNDRTEIVREVSHFLVCSGHQTLIDFTKFSENSRKIRCFQSNLINARFSPAFMFVGEGLSKLLMVILVSLISLERSRESFSGSPVSFWIPRLENFTIVLAFGLCMYEYGELCGNTMFMFPSWNNSKRYIFSIWNVFDIAALCLLVGWIVARFRRSPDCLDARRFIAVSVIFYSITLLRYLSLVSSIGKLVSLIYAMTQALAKFVIVLAFPIFGYMIAMFSLYRNLDASFNSAQQTLLTLFSDLFSNFDSTFTTTFGDSVSYNAIGIIIQMVYIMFLGLVIMNLIIAQMTRSHDDFNARATQLVQHEWAKTTYQFMLIEERNPFCMLPPLLNILPSVLAPLHFLNFYGIEKARNASLMRISIAGTASDIMIGILGCFVAPFIEFVSYLRHLEQPDEKLFEIGVMAFFCSVLYPLYVTSLFLDLYNTGFTYVSIESNDTAATSLRAFVKFETAPHRYEFEKATHRDELLNQASEPSKLKIQIKLLRICNLQKCTNPVVKFRVGPFEVRSGPSLYGGSNPQWTNEELVLRLDNVKDKVISGEYPNLDIEVVDQITGDEITVAMYEHDGSAKLREWIGDRRFEGEIKLTGGKNTQQASLFVAIKIHLTFDEAGLDDEKSTIPSILPIRIKAKVGSSRRVAPEDHDGSTGHANYSSLSTTSQPSKMQPRPTMEKIDQYHLVQKDFDKVFLDEELTKIFKIALGDGLDDTLQQTTAEPAGDDQRMNRQDFVPEVKHTSILMSDDDSPLCEDDERDIDMMSSFLVDKAGIRRVTQHQVASISVLKQLQKRQELFRELSGVGMLDIEIGAVEDAVSSVA